MMDNEPKPTFDQWCIVELMGRQVIAGRVTEQTIGGCAFLRVDVPETEKQPAFTRFYGQAAIYAMTPVSEEVARVSLRRFTPEPVNVYVPELRQLAPVFERDDDEDDDEDDDDYGDPGF
jgi:hypothetical protein